MALIKIPTAFHGTGKLSEASPGVYAPLREHCLKTDDPLTTKPGAIYLQVVEVFYF